jgi:hypothetical protein
MRTTLKASWIPSDRIMKTTVSELCKQCTLGKLDIGIQIVADINRLGFALNL